MGVTRKEKLLKAMLNDNAEACRGGVTREERIIASVSKKVCDNDALEGGGNGGGSASGGASSVGAVDWNDIQNKPFYLSEVNRTFTEADYQNMYHFDVEGVRFYRLFEGDYYDADIVGSSFVQTVLIDEDWDDVYEKTETQTVDVEYVISQPDQHSKRVYDDNGGIYLFTNGSFIAIDDAAQGVYVEEPGIYLRCNHPDNRVNEFTLLTKKRIDEAYLPKKRNLSMLTVNGELVIVCEDGCCYHKIKVDCEGNLTTEPYEFEEDE